MKFKIDENRIHYLYPYYPKRYLEHKGDSEEILKFKRNDPQAVKRFSDEFADAILVAAGDKVSRLDEFVLFVVPSHNSGEWSTGLLSIASHLCDLYNMKNASKMLVRVKSHERLSSGGIRSEESHIKTISLSSEIDVTDKRVIIIDDITTSGNSLLACAHILREAGAKKGILAAIGKTTEGTEIDIHAALCE